MTSPPPGAHPDLIVYDLDGVITTRDSFSALILARLRRAPLRLLRALPATAVMLLGAQERRRRVAAARVAEIALAGMRDEDYTELASTFGDRIGEDPAWMRVGTVERIRRQHSRGVRIVIATATEERLAQALLARAGVPYDLLSASALTETESGMQVADHRVGARKVEALREQGVAVETAEFVTDSFTDLPTARAAGRVILIGASEKTRRRYSRAGLVIADEAV